ncbi:MAG TPA: cardiolipin synthase [Noviherbaspirillum sp.]|nr:cardiolipin synthase [Noviherbaspirillum sp.]
MPRSSHIRTIVWTAIVTVILALVVTNLTTADPRLRTQVEHRYGVAEPQFLRTMGVLLGPPVAEGNSVQHLENGVRIFPAMLEAIASAERTITFEMYIYWSGEIADRFAAALIERARSGVKVHVLLDWVGSAKMDLTLIDRMRDGGIEVERFHKPTIRNLPRMNNRTHRRILVIDGKVGFTGGVGIGDEWTGDAHGPDHWRESHFRVEGPVVAQMQAVFVDNWTRATGRVLYTEDYFPSLTARGQAPAQMFSSSPAGGSESMHLMYLLAISAAQESILLSGSYFVPDALAVEALVKARERGVRVSIIVPGPHMDVEVVRRASRARWGELLAAGVEIAEYQPTMYHVKVLVIDGFMVSVGSTNFDNRSFRINDEASLNVYDRQLAAQMQQVFEADLAKSKRVTLEMWENRPFREKVVEQVASQLGRQL